jgi:hypothetical protein
MDPQQFKLQGEAREQLQSLAEAMSPIAADIEQVRKLTKSEHLEETIKKFTALMTDTIRLIDEMVEKKGIKGAIGAYKPVSHTFLSAYALGPGKFLQAPSTKSTIDELKQSLDAFRREFHQRISIEALSAIKNVAKVQGELSTISVHLSRLMASETEKGDAELKKLEDRLVKGIEFNSQAVKCMEGTSDGIKADVRTAIKDGKNIVWITGYLGVGKSALASSIASELATQQQSTFYFRFDRAKPDVNTNALWRLIAYKLASRYPSVRSSILEWMQNEDVDLTSPNIDRLFTGLIMQPLSKLASDSTSLPGHHRIVIVIDALDECGGLDGLRSQDRRNLLQTLAHWPQLEARFKLVVTSRREGDIVRVLTSISTHIDILSGELPKADLNESQVRARALRDNDIRTFLADRFSAIVQKSSSLKSRGWPGNDILDDLTYRAAGVFQWANTAAKFIDGGLRPEARLKKIMDNDPNAMKGLYSLYFIVLETAFSDDAADSDEVNLLLSVLGTMVWARRPLCLTEYTELLEMEGSALESIKDGLSPVLGPGPTLHFAHQSFTDFLLSIKDPHPFSLNKPNHQRTLAEFCLRTMIDKLRFDICDLENSSLKNADVPGIEEKVEKCIPTLLSYSCCFFADHLNHAAFDKSLTDLVKRVFYDKLLYLMEALSLLKEINRLPLLLRDVLHWSNVCTCLFCPNPNSDIFA